MNEFVVCQQLSYYLESEIENLGIWALTIYAFFFPCVDLHNTELFQSRKAQRVMKQRKS